MNPLDQHASGGAAFNYPRAGDPLPPGGATVLLLTEGRTCVTGNWDGTARYIGWAHLPKRDKTKEKLL